MNTLDYDRLYLGGRWRPPSSARRIQVTGAATEDHVGSVPEATAEDVDRAVRAARDAFDDPTGWSAWPPSRRAQVLERFATSLEARAEETARRVSIQNGMPLWLSGKVETTFPALLLRYYAGLVTGDTDELRAGVLGGLSLVRRAPAGVVAAIVPWNVPQCITFFKLAPALAAGDTVVLKPAPETVLDAFLMAEAAAEAGLPPGVLAVVPGGPATGDALVTHPGVDLVSFTGSSAAGRDVAGTCGRLLRPVTLELGGKSAAVVLDDADLAGQLDHFFEATLLNSGQICWLGTRVLLPRSRYRELLGVVSDLASSLPVGDPMDLRTRVGPLVSRRQRDRVERYIAVGRAQGARVTAGGGRPPGLDRGWYVQPTVLADVKPGSTVAQEEIFGPVLAVLPYRDEDEAVALANDSGFGLAGSVWTSDPERGASLARRVRTGTIGVNRYLTDPGAPFGGLGDSGWGRELGPEGLRPYQRLQTVYLDRP